MDPFTAMLMEGPKIGHTPINVIMRIIPRMTAETCVHHKFSFRNAWISSIA
jgi:hypothetical protein